MVSIDRSSFHAAATARQSSPMSALAPASAPVTVDLPAGPVLGQRQAIAGHAGGGECLAFRGLPYAEAPIGPRRFAPPEPIGPRDDPVDATRAGPIAPQLPALLRRATGEIEARQAEDCLHLTVWTPACDGGKRPVLLWFHGGSWQAGGGALDWYDGAALALRGDIVVVAVNYRLGALGWLHVPEQVVNPGLLDQECAMRWVLDHVAAFGGDPSRLTAMGHSAGATNLAAMLVRGAPIERIILQSPRLVDAFRPAPLAAALGERLLQASGVATVEQARSLPVSKLLLAQTDPRVTAWLRSEPTPRGPFCPVLDGSMLPVDIDAALAGATGRADVLIGYTLDELSAFSDSPRDSALDDSSERQFGAPARWWAESAIARGRDAWLYRFDLAPTMRFGACHGIELPFVFGNVGAFGDAPMLRGLDRRLAGTYVDSVQAIWLDFIRGGTAGWPQAPAIRSLP